jgi:hypothetical protein
MKTETAFGDYWLYLMDDAIPARERLRKSEFELGVNRREAFRCEQETRRLCFQARMLELTIEQLREATTAKQCKKEVMQVLEQERQCG